jgi:hypothetical protein
MTKLLAVAELGAWTYRQHLPDPIIYPSTPAATSMCPIIQRNAMHLIMQPCNQTPITAMHLAPLQTFATAAAEESAEESAEDSAYIVGVGREAFCTPTSRCITTAR